MLARPTVVAPLALALLACRPEAHTNTAATPPDATSRRAPVAAEPDPSHLLLPWDAPLLTSPNAGAPALQRGLGEASSPARAVAVLGREGDFWQIETIDAQALTSFAAEPIEGLDVYRLRLYVPIGVGEPLRPIPPGPDEATTPSSDARARAIDEARNVGILGALMLTNPPVQTGESRPRESTTDFRVSPSTPVYWPDGRLAGEVVTEHVFVQRGTPIASPSGELRCFSIRVGVVHEPDDGQLCFAAQSVQEVAFVPEPSFDTVWGDELGDDYGDAMIGGLIGTEIGDAWGEGGFGMTGSGVGGGGTGAGDIAIGEIGTLGRGGGSVGGLGTLGREITVTTLDATGSMDGDIGRRIVRAHRDELDACWTAHAGEVEVELSLDVDDGGNVTASKAVSQPAALGDCIEGATATWSFPAALPGTLVVRITF